MGIVPAPLLPTSRSFASVRAMKAARTLAIASVLTITSVLALSGCAPEPDPAPEVTPIEEPATPEPAEEVVEAEPVFDRSQHSIDDPMSIWVVSNKLRPLNPVEFHPTDLVMPEGVENEFTQPLREPAARAVEEMLAGAQEAGLSFRIISAYRDVGTQRALYDSYVARDGQALADTYSARPGHSEHQTGLVADFDDYGGCYLNACFGETAVGAWLAEHAADYGFIIRYPEGYEHITGFTYEPWHFRYVGTDLALEMRETGVQTLEEFFDLPPAPDYAAN